MNGMQELLPILKRNILSPIAIAIFVLSMILLALNETRDAVFLSFVLVVNILIAVIQEVRAQIALKKLELMNAPLAHKIGKNGKVLDVPFDSLTPGDMIELRLGDEVPADCTISKSDGIELDESILTGESIPVFKDMGETAYAASQVVAGKAKVQVRAVGANTRIGGMTASLKRYHPQMTPMQRDINIVIYWLTYGAVGLAILITAVYVLSGESFVTILKTITSAAVAIVPEGLLLASSLLLAFGSLKLAAAKVLPQKLSAIEGMAQLNVLCVDKTGTLTSDKISFDSVDAFEDGNERFTELVAIANKETASSSPTSMAISNTLKPSAEYEVIERLQFSSDRKMSGAKFKLDGRIYATLIGAPEYLAKNTKLTDKQSKHIDNLAKLGKRVMLVVNFDDLDVSLKKIDGKKGQALGVIVLANELREGVTNTVDFLQNNGVAIKVISGDNPHTVSYIAKQAGIKNASKMITGAELQNLNKKAWKKIVKTKTIFARVLPEQKERLIATFEKYGYYTGMIGDGVNDALALKKADLGVAMYAGATATRRIADIILLDNSFNSLPMGMKLGNRIMQAIEIIATLFFHKIIYGVVLLFMTLACGIVYPFEPRHLTFMNILLVTTPTILWTLFTPIPKRRLSPKKFWLNTLVSVLPIAILSGVMVSVSYVILSQLHPNDISGVMTTTVLIATLFGVYLVFLIPKMFNVIPTQGSKTIMILYSIVSVLVVFVAFGFGLMRDFFAFTRPAYNSAWPLPIMIILVMFIQYQIAKWIGNKKMARDLK